MPLEQGDHCKTGANSFAEILVGAGLQVRLEKNHEITLSELAADCETKSISSGDRLRDLPKIAERIKAVHPETLKK